MREGHDRVPSDQTEPLFFVVRKDNQLVMDDWAFNMLKSVHTEAGVFSEIFVNVGTLQRIGQEQGMNIQDAIWAVMHARRLSP